MHFRIDNPNNAELMKKIRANEDYARQFDEQAAAYLNNAGLLRPSTPLEFMLRSGGSCLHFAITRASLVRDKKGLSQGLSSRDRRQIAAKYAHLYDTKKLKEYLRKLQSSIDSTNSKEENS